MKVALRDDDTSYFTAPETLEQVYGDVWGRVPVCLAVVPFAVGYEQAGIPPEHWHSGEMFALERNPVLVGFLRELIRSGRITVALHGYSHQDFPGGYEFQAAPDLPARLGRGRAYLESLLGCRISIFVPPHNALSRRGLEAVAGARLHILGSFLSFRPSMRPWEWRTAINWWRIRRYRRASGRTRRDPLVYPHPLRYAGHAEFGCHGLVPGTTFAALRTGFEEARRDGGDFCVATHYWEMNAELKGVLREFLEFAGREPGVRFVKAEELFEPAGRRV